MSIIKINALEWTWSLFYNIDLSHRIWSADGVSMQLLDGHTGAITSLSIHIPSGFAYRISSLLLLRNLMF